MEQIKTLCTDNVQTECDQMIRGRLPAL